MLRFPYRWFHSVDSTSPVLAAVAGTLALAIGCGGAETTGTVRLVERFDPEHVVDPTMVAASAPSAVWDFDEGEPEGWRALGGVADLRTEDGELAGRTTSGVPVIVVERPAPELPDQVHALEIRMRVSSGATLRAVHFGAPEMADEEILGVAGVVGFSTWATPIEAGDEFQTYVIENQQSLRDTDVRHLALVPTDVEGADFEIDSIRIVTQAEHLASIPSGAGWQGLKDIYRETLVSRAPESIRMPMTLPERPWLDLHVGTVDQRPVTFRVSVIPRGGGDADGARILERTVTIPHRWEPTHVDLADWSGRDVVLELALDSDEPGALGFWGSPVVRFHGGGSRAAVQPPAVIEALGAKAAEPPRGVIVILADTLRRDHLSPYDYERDTAPALARMSARGVTFADTVAQATWTKVSAPSIFTSLHPTSHRVLDFDHRLSDAASTLAEIYRDAGYATVGYSSVLFTGKFSNMQQGYEELHEGASLDDQEYPSKTGREFVDRAAQWLELHRDGPFFVLLHLFDPHDPFEPRPPFDAMWADPLHAQEHEENRASVREEIEDPLLGQFGMPSRAEIEAAGVDPDRFIGYDIDWYDGSIRGMDIEVARLAQRLDELELADDTLIVFIADHGEEFLDHGRTFHGQSVYGELTGIPLIMRWPGALPADVVIGDTVRSIDLMPTLLQLSHLPVPEFLQGQSLLPLIAAGGQAAPGGSGQAVAHSGRGREPLHLAEAAARWGWSAAPAVAEKARTEHLGGPPPRHTESYAIVLDGWKLVHHVERDDGTPEFELFDHRTDPLDQNDVAGDHPDIVERLRAELAAVREMALAARLPEAESLDDLSPEEMERLRSLGYIR